MKIEPNPLGGKGKPRALVIDNDPVFRKFAQRVLVGAGWTVDEADGVKGALNLARNHKYVWILIDHRLPNAGDGAYLARTIRSGGGRSAAAYLTGTSMVDVGDECMEAGMNEFLLKPAEPAQLRETAEHLASRTRDDEAGQLHADEIEQQRNRLVRAIDKLRDHTSGQDADLRTVTNQHAE